MKEITPMDQKRIGHALIKGAVVVLLELASRHMGPRKVYEACGEWCSVHGLPMPIAQRPAEQAQADLFD